jgi:nucleotide-binding universal stress UspA family protein
MARDESAQLLVAHVVREPLPFTAEGYLLPQASNELEAAVRRDAMKQLESLLSRTRQAGVHVEGLLLKGRPEKAIARAAKKHRVDLVVVGTHGRTGLPRILLGSVASRIIGAATCPVLAVPSGRGFASRAPRRLFPFRNETRSDSLGAGR